MPGLFDFSEDFNGKKKENTAGPQPVYTPYVQGYDPRTMSMLSDLEELWPQYSKGYDAFKEEALRKGPSQWLNMSRLAADLKTRDQKEKGRQEVAGATAAAKNNLAAGGGLSSGARERAEEQGQKNVMSMSQGLTRENNLNDLNMNIQDEGNRVTQLQALPGMEKENLKMWQTAKGQDVANQTAETGRLNNYNMTKYQADMSAWAGAKQADATANSGKDSGK